MDKLLHVVVDLLHGLGHGHGTAFLAEQREGLFDFHHDFGLAIAQAARIDLIGMRAFRHGNLVQADGAGVDLALDLQDLLEAGFEHGSKT